MLSYCIAPTITLLIVYGLRWRIFDAFAEVLIVASSRTPYFHLTGYMERFWLVPYAQVIPRKTMAPWWFSSDEVARPAWLRSGEIEITVYDGTGPLDWLTHPVGRLIQKLGYAIRVHHILRSDHGRDPHDHPWPYLTIILRGGYWESLFDEHGTLLSKKWHGPGSVLRRPANTWHRLDVPEGQTAWTLFITGEKKQTWGFNVGGAKVDHKTYREQGGMQ